MMLGFRKFIGLIFLPVVCCGLSYSQIGELNQATERYREEWKRGQYPTALEQLNALVKSREDLERIRAYRYLQWLVDRSELKFMVGDVEGAIEDLSIVSERVREPASTLRLAQLYHYKGDLKTYHELLNRAMTEAQFRWYFYNREQNILAIAKVSELQGENPKYLLSSFYTTIIESYPGYVEAYVGAGDLALDKGDYGLAESYYIKALAIDEEHQEALAGLAECYHAGGDPRVQATTAKLLNLNPMHYRGNGIVLQNQLESGQIDAALEKIESLLDVNPYQLEIKALKATAYFLLDEIGEMEAVQAEILAFNPHYSGAYRIPGRMASQKYRFKEGAALQRKALELNPDDIKARAQYALDLMRLGKEDEGKIQLDAVFEADPYHVQAFNLLELLDTIADYEVIDTGPVTIKMPRHESPVWKDEIIALVKRAYDKYQFKYDIDLETPIYIEIFDHHDDFMVRSVGLPGSVGFLGICFGHLVTMDSPTARPKHSMNWRSVLWHEFVHVITLQKTHNRMPRWLSEGISVYGETEYSAAFGQKFDVSYKSLIELGNPPGMMELELMFTQPKSSNHIQLGYYLAGKFAAFYIDEYGMRALNQALDAIGSGADTLKALADGAGLRPGEVNGAFHEYLSRELSFLKNLPDLPEEEPEEDVMSLVERYRERGTSWYDLRSPYTDTMKQGLEAIRHQEWEAAESLMQQAQELFPEVTGSYSPLVQLSLIYKETGQTEKQIDALWDVLNHDGANYSACLELIKILTQRQEWGEVKRVCERALGIDPFDVEILNLHQRALEHLGHYSEAAIVAQKRAALEPSYAVEHRLKRVTYLQRAEDYVQAKQELLELLEEYPHYWEAQQLLLNMTGHLN